MNQKCALPQNIVEIDGKHFILPNFNPNLILSNSFKPELNKLPQMNAYNDEAACKINAQKEIRKQPPHFENSRKNRNNDEFTHFVSIPLLDIKDKIAALQDELQNESYDDLNDHFNDPCQTHLTLCMLSLNSEEQRRAVIKVMDENASEIKKILSETKINLKGLGYFETFAKRRNEKYKKTYARILYLKLEENAAYQAIEKLLDFIVKKFLNAKILTESQLSHIKFDRNANMYKGDNFHITVMRARDDRGFAVDYIMEKLKYFNLGSTDIKTVDVSTRFKYDNDGYYEPLHRIHLKK